MPEQPDPERLVADLAGHVHCPACGTPVALDADPKQLRELGMHDRHRCLSHIVADHRCDDCHEWIGVLRNGRKLNMPDGSPHECEWAPVPVVVR